MSSTLPTPTAPRAVAFIDGQNLFYAAKETFGYRHPNYDPHALATRVCADRGWDLVEVRFYTGVPDATDNAFWNGFWVRKTGAMGHRGVVVWTRPLRYRFQSVTLADGSTHTFRSGSEKGTDVRIALDLIRLAHRNTYDVGLVFSQDQDLSEATDEVRVIGQDQSRFIRLASAFPSSSTQSRYKRRGIERTDWIPIDKPTYDACIDPTDYRTPPSGTP